MSILRRYHREGNIYFITNVTFRRKPVLVDNADLLWTAFKTLRSKAGFDMMAWVILPDHFHIVIDPNGSEGVLMVTPLGSDTPRLFPFFTGWNPILVKQVHVDAGNVATNVYWGK